MDSVAGLERNRKMVDCPPRTRVARAALLAVLLVLGFVPAWLAQAQEPDLSVRFFQETQHNVYGPFLRFYDQHGGLAFFGYPLTEVIERDGRVVQYFQRAEMELHQAGKPDEYVELGLLGTALQPVEPPIPPSDIPPPDHADRFYFAETGHTVSFGFLEFFRAHGGVDVLGYPITEWVIEPNGRIVQYFERVKLEWYPENVKGKRVQLGMLGTIYAMQYMDPVYLSPAAPNGPSVTVTPTPIGYDPDAGVNDLRVSVTLKEPIIGLGSEQTVYVYVFDGSFPGVPGISVEMEVRYPNGQTEQFSLPPTNEGGHTMLQFAMGSPSPGRLVVLNVTVRYGDRTAQASTVCLPWW